MSCIIWLHWKYPVPVLYILLNVISYYRIQFTRFRLYFAHRIKCVAIKDKTVKANTFPHIIHFIYEYAAYVLNPPFQLMHQAPNQITG